MSHRSPVQIKAVSVRALILQSFAALLLSACATAPYMPAELDSVPFRDRAQTQTEGPVTLIAAVPGPEETRALFDLPLYDSGIQPIWLEVRHGTESQIRYAPVGTDPDYFSPEEVAMSYYFYEMAMPHRIPAGETRSGFIFTHAHPGTKSFNVDIHTDEGQIVGFTFFVPVPGLRLDHQDVDWDNLYTDDELRDLEKDALLEALRNMPCCTTDKKSKGSGDPLNLVVIGSIDDVYYAFIRAGWDETEVISRSSLTKMAGAFVTGSEYKSSPVSGLYVFGRPQDAAFQKARDNINERNHLRLWMSPIRFEGTPVWLGQISRDIGVRLTAKTITTHKVDPDVDETREYLVENLAYSQSLAKLGYADGVGAAPIDEPRGNLTGDPYFTDGLRVVLWVASQPTDIGAIEDLDWGAEPIR